jgi:SulP family sulfate permease
MTKNGIIATEVIGQGIGNMLAAACGESLVQEQRRYRSLLMLEVKLESQEQFMAYFTSRYFFRFRFISSVYHYPFWQVTNSIGFKIIDIKGLKHLLRVPEPMQLVLICANNHYFQNLIQLVGVALASILFMKGSGEHHNRICRNLKDETVAR